MMRWQSILESKTMTKKKTSKNNNPLSKPNFSNKGEIISKLVKMAQTWIFSNKKREIILVSHRYQSCLLTPNRIISVRRRKGIYHLDKD